MLYKVQTVLSTVENVYKEMEIKFRSSKKQQETITDRLIETGSTEEQFKTNRLISRSEKRSKGEGATCMEHFIPTNTRSVFNNWNAHLFNS